MHGSKYVTNQSMHGSKYVTDTPTWERCSLQSSSVYPYDEDQEAPWLQNPWRTNATASSREKWTRADCLQSQYVSIKPFASCLTALKIILIYIWKSEFRNSR